MAMDILPIGLFTMANAGLATENASALALALHFFAGSIAGGCAATVVSNNSALRFALVAGVFFMLPILLTQGAGVPEGNFIDQLLDLKTASAGFVLGVAFGLSLVFPYSGHNANPVEKQRERVRSE
jgi:putative Mn2+ efflux pump MntP